MERENLINLELTGQAQNAYSSGMAENGGASPEVPNEPTSEQRVQRDLTDSARRTAEDDARRISSSQTESPSPDQEQISNLDQILNDPSLPSDLRAAAEKHREELTGIPTPSGSEEPAASASDHAPESGGSGGRSPGDTPPTAEGSVSPEPENHKNADHVRRDERGDERHERRRERSKEARRGSERNLFQGEISDEDIIKFGKELVPILLRPAVREMLASEEPDFHQAGVEKKNQDIEDFVGYIESINPISEQLVAFATFMSRSELKIPIDRFKEALKDNDKFLEAVKDVDENPTIEISMESRKVLFEWAVEKLISISDKSPEAHYSIGGFSAQNILDNLRSLSTTAFPEKERFAERLASVIETRELFHELRRKLPQREAYLGFLTEALKTHGIHFVQNEMPGVHQVISQLERRYFHAVSKSSEWISSADADKAEIDAEKTINEMWEQGFLKTGVWKEGKLVGERNLTEWEKNRALAMGKTFYAGLQRKAVAVGAGDLRPETSGRIGSRPNEYIFRTMYAVKSIGVRFHGQGAAQKDFISRILKKKQEQEASGHTKTKSLMGVSAETMMVNQWGAPDLQSHGWRSQFLFLSAIKIKERGTLLNVIDEATRNNNLSIDATDGSFKTNSSNPLFGLEDSNFDQSKFENEIREFVLGQNLYLSVLARQSYSEELKTRIWEKRATLDPLALATLRPEIIGELNELDRAVWDGVVGHLDIAHGIRMQEELQRYEHGLSEDEIRTEAAKYSNGIHGEGKYRIINEEGYLKENLDEEQKRVLRSVIDKGYGEANYLATAVFPHTYMLDDAPYVAWADEGEGTGLGDENMFRGFGDQKTLQDAGWAPLNNLFQNPTLGATGEVFDKAYAEGLAMIHSPGAAREYLEPFVLGWLDFASATERSKWIGVFEKERGIARSPIEKYYPKSFIAMDEEDKSGWLNARAQAGSVSPDKKGLDRIKKEAKASRRHLMTKIMRTWLQILPFVFIAQFIKTMGLEIKGAAEENTK